MRSASPEEHLSDQSAAYRIIQMSKRRNPSVAVNQHRLCTTPESSVAQQMNLVSWSKPGLIRPISDPVLAAFALITDKLRSRWIRSRLSRRHRLLLSLTHHSVGARRLNGTLGQFSSKQFEKTQRRKTLNAVTATLPRLNQTN